MKCAIRRISGIDDAIMSLMFSRRSYTEEIDLQIKKDLADISDPLTGAILPTKEPEFPAAYHNIESWLKKVAKYGAGVGMSTAIDAGHDTLLRFIDFTVVVEGLHRGAQDDLDAHAMRMENRIVRSSTRLGLIELNRLKSTYMSDWYKDKIVTFEDYLANELGDEFDSVLPIRMYKDGVQYTRTISGYVRDDLINDDDARRGLYRLSMASDCIFKINLYNARHLYKRRNIHTKASPELKELIESFADQAESMLPHLGLLVRYDWAYDVEHDVDTYKHIANINKEV